MQAEEAALHVGYAWNKRSLTGSKNLQLRQVLALGFFELPLLCNKR